MRLERETIVPTFAWPFEGLPVSLSRQFHDFMDDELGREGKITQAHRQSRGDSLSTREGSNGIELPGPIGLEIYLNGQQRGAVAELNKCRCWNLRAVLTEPFQIWIGSEA